MEFPTTAAHPELLSADDGETYWVRCDRAVDKLGALEYVRRVLGLDDEMLGATAAGPVHMRLTPTEYDAQWHTQVPEQGANTETYWRVEW